MCYCSCLLSLTLLSFSVPAVMTEPWSRAHKAKKKVGDLRDGANHKKPMVEFHTPGDVQGFSRWAWKMQPSATPVQLGSCLLLAPTDLLCLLRTAHNNIRINASVSCWLSSTLFCIYFSSVCVKTCMFHILFSLDKWYLSFNVLGDGSLGSIALKN